MKSFLDNELTLLVGRHVPRTASAKRSTKESPEPSIYDVIQAIKAESQTRPDDKGLKYAVSQLHFFGRKNGYHTLAKTLIPTINSTCAKMFPYSRVASVLSTGLEKLALRLDVKFLDKVAELVHSQEDYDNTIGKLELDDNSIKAVSTRNYLTAKINTLKGADTVNNLMYDMEEVATSEVTPLSQSIMQNETLLKAYHKKVKPTLVEISKEAEIHNIIDFSQFPVSYECFDVRTAQYQILDTIPQEEWVTYLHKMADSGIEVQYNEEIDAFEVSSFNVKAEEPKAPPTKYEYEHRGPKAPAGLKQKTLEPEEGKKKGKEIIEKLSGQAKEAFTKVFNQSTQLRKIKAKQLEKEAELTAIKSSLKEEQVKISEELTNYLKFAESASQKLGIAEEIVYALETQEEMFLTAIHKSVSKMSADPSQVQVFVGDANDLIARLKKMGDHVAKLVEEAEKQQIAEASLYKTIDHVTKTLYTWEVPEKDRPKIKESDIKQAGPLDKLKSMFMSAISGVKKYLGFVDFYVDSLTEEYQEVMGMINKWK